MASSDEEGEIVPDFEVVENGYVPVAFLLGTTDGGLQSVYKEVIGWKLELSDSVPEVCVLSKGKTWINLQKPRKSYEDIVKSVLIVAHCLHLVKRNIKAARNEILSHLLKTLSLYDFVEPDLKKSLSAHLPLIRSAMSRDTDLAKSEYLKEFLLEIENPGRRETLHKEILTTNKPKFIVSDEDDEIEDEFDEEAGVFDEVCAYCDNGGDVLPCEGQCMRSFHPTVDAGVDTFCESLGFENAAQYEAIATFLCPNCKHQKHQCFHCGLLGSSDKSSKPEVFPCVSATCEHFYHPQCVAKLHHPSDETLANELESQIAAGKSFTCPIHKCYKCQGAENKDDRELQFAVCRRCPKSYHRKCLPKQIAFEGSADGSIQQRAWDDLLPKRILMYCMEHKIIPYIWTPKRDHLRFPIITWERNQEGRRTKVMSERRSKAFGNYRVSDTTRMPKVVERRFNTVTCGDAHATLEKDKSSTMHKKTSSFEDNKSIPRNLELPINIPRIRSPVKNMEVASFPKVDAEIKTKILKLVKDSTSSFDSEEYIKEKKRRCTHKIYTPQYGLDKTITMGKVEASVKAVKAALKKLEDGGSIEDAKAVCEPNVLDELIRWKKKLSVFLAPFLIGDRYTSFGRHFTKADKLKEIVNRLHWYVDGGDTIVDFCCGSNDFSCFMKEKLESTGKKCNFKNYDLITPKNTFNFEKRDWFSVPLDALPDGSSLVMGLNPPFGVKASLANKFIEHALKFKPKLLILIVPEETRRLDHRRSPYNLIWEELEMLSGKSFYLPGSMDKRDQPLDDWNVKPPPLSLWSRADWTAQHIQIAEKHGHIEQKQTTPHQEAERVVSIDLMEENQEENLDCFNDLSNIMTNYPDLTMLEHDATLPNFENPNMTSHAHDDMVDMDLSSPVTSPNNSRSEPTRLYPPRIHPGPHPGFGPPHFANTSDPFGQDVGFSFPQPGNYANYNYPSFCYPNYGQSDYASQHARYDFLGSTSNNGQPGFTSQAGVWPPGTTRPNYRYN